MANLLISPKFTEHPGGAFAQTAAQWGKPAHILAANMARRDAIRNAFATRTLAGLQELGADACGDDPAPAQVTLMSSPNCSPMDNVCVLLTQQIEEYNNALQINATKLWEQAWCKKQNCQNQGTPGYPRDCAAIYPLVSVPPQPSYPGAQAILQTSGVVVGYGTQPIGTTTNYGYTSGTQQTGQEQPTQQPATNAGVDEIAQAKKIYLDLFTKYGVATNSAVIGMFNAEFNAGIEWYRGAYGSYIGLANYVRANADAKVREWISKAGVTKTDGTPTQPVKQQVTQPGVVPTDTGSGATGAGSAADRLLGSMTQEVQVAGQGFPMWLLAVAGVAALMMFKGGR